MSKWREVSVDDLAANTKSALATGPFGSAVGKKHFVDVGVPMIRGSNLSTDVGVRLLDEQLVFLPEEVVSKFERSTVRRGDLVFTCWGTIGQIGLIDGSCRYERYIVSNKQMKLTPNGELVDSRFLYYSLSSPDNLDQVQRQAIGSAVPGFNLGQLRQIRIAIPDLPTQRAIASVLGSIDDLIETNRRRIAALEEMAQAIYREWFVNFRYPGHEDATFIDSPLGPIPEGWKVCSIADLCLRIQAGGTPKRSDQSFWANGTVDWYKTGDLTDSVLIGSSEQITEHAVAVSSTRSFEPETILMAIYGSPTVGRLGLVETTCCANQAALGLSADPHVSSAIHLWFVLRDLREPLNRIAQGAAQQNVSKTIVAESATISAPVELVEQFTHAADPAWRLSHRLAHTNAALVIMRDLLLPKLVTGQIDVSGLDLDAAVGGVS